ncbi:2-dehydropantoate 2-reductase [Rhizodiscina lignyota]|uniref:2-dehydropantoate 2-reductase n=1 Tax=Rhizodiscina lignyota TaxID=1504668 RepID=A0A9P4M738_9PEZI|nr:2-dehydropantoate 2-reductase [Rhizodiscina lignyota]
MAPNVLIFGAGAIGSIYVYILDQAGANVTAVCRSNYQAAKEHGFEIMSEKFGHVKVKSSVVRTVEEASGQEWDYVLVCSKAMCGSRPTTAEILKPVVGAKTAIVLLQNGISIEEEYIEAYPSNPVISVVVYLPATQLASGIIKMGDLEYLEVGTYPSDAPSSHKEAASAFCDLIKAGKGHAILYDDVQPRRWSKLIVNAPWNPLCALARSTDVAFMNASPQATDVVWSVMKEIVAIANALGYAEINEEEAAFQLGRAKARIPDKGIEPSMLADIWLGRAMEVEAIVGNTVRIAEKKGVPAPGLTMIYVLTKALDESNARQRILKKL